MWLLVAREPLPDAPHWPGRSWLAALDAVAWPLAAIALVIHLDQTMSLGVVKLVVLGVAPLLAASRLHRALWANHRYRFTTWRWGKPMLMLLAVGLVMKIAVTIGA